MNRKFIKVEIKIHAIRKKVFDFTNFNKEIVIKIKLI
jgi:hypothetical protein